MLISKPQWDAFQIQEAVKRICQDGGQFPVVHKSGSRTIVRYHVGVNKSVIIKLWTRPLLKQKLRRLLHLSSADYEWENQNRFYQLGINVPVPLGYGYLPDTCAPYTEAIVMQDLGSNVLAMEHVKQCMLSGKEQQLSLFEEKLIGMTRSMINGHILDVDHGLINIVVAKTEPIRIDFEMARRVRWPSLHFQVYGEMLGQLLATYTYAVQPQTPRVVKFAKQLVEAIDPPRLVLWSAAHQFHKKMAYQKEHVGVDTVVKLPWT